MTINGFVAYVKQLWKNKPDTSTPLSAARLTHMEDGIKGNSDAIEKLAAAVVSQIANDPNKIASMAALYSVNQIVTQLNSDIASKADKAALNVVGQLSYKTTSATPAEHGNSTKLHSLLLDPGTWIIESQINWAVNTSGRREHAIRQGGAWNSTLLAGNSHSADPTSSTYQNCTGVISVADTTEVSVWGIQTSGSTLNFGGTIKALRLK